MRNDTKHLEKEGIPREIKPLLGEMPAEPLKVKIGETYELVDIAAEKARMEKEIAGCKKEIGQLEGKLSNPGFVQKAPPAVVEADREKLAKAKDRLEKLEESIKQLG